MSAKTPRRAVLAGSAAVAATPLASLPALAAASAFRWKMLTDLCGRFDEPLGDCESLWLVCCAERAKNNVAEVAMSVVGRVESELRQLKGFAEIILEQEG